MARLLQIAQLGHPILRKVAENVVDVHTVEISELISDMMATAAEVDGVGIAAPQVFHSKRIIIVASRPNSRYPHAPFMEPTAIINPVIKDLSQRVESDWEGCLSIPGIRGLVPRAYSLTLEFTDREGLKRCAQYEGFPARIIQHEVDHLDGVCFVDRMETMSDLVTEREYQKIVASGASLAKIAGGGK